MTIEFPRRVERPYPPGSLLKSAAQPRQRKEVAGRDLAYLAKIRQLPCLDCGMEPCGEAAHVRMASAAYGKSSGMGKTPEDRWALPLCGDDHRVQKHAQHQGSEAAFWTGLNINALLTCTRLQAVAGDLLAMRSVVLLTIEERGKR